MIKFHRLDRQQLPEPVQVEMTGIQLDPESSLPATSTHLQRHINDRHEKKKEYLCTVLMCGRTYVRKHDWKRHMTTVHGLDAQQLPEPVQVEIRYTVGP